MANPAKLFKYNIDEYVHYTWFDTRGKKIKCGNLRKESNNWTYQVFTGTYVLQLVFDHRISKTIIKQ